MRILGTGSALPAHTLTNDDLTKFLDTSDEWIRTHTGIRSRQVITDETLLQLAARAANAHFTERTGAFELMPFVTEAVKQETMDHIRIFGSEGRV